MNHIVQFSHLSVFVSNDWKIYSYILCFINVIYPSTMLVKWINTKSKYFYISLSKFFLQRCSSSKLGSTYRSIISRVRKQNTPTVSKVFVEINGSYSCVGSKIWDLIS